MKYQSKKGFVCRKIADELLLIPIGNKTTEFNGLVRINETGQFLWECLSSPKTIAELVELLKQEFNTKDMDVEKDVLDFITASLKEDLIEEIRSEE